MRISLGGFDTPWPVIVARKLSRDCLLCTDFSHQNKCKFGYDTGTFIVGTTEGPVRYQRVKPVACRVVLRVHTDIEPERLKNGFERNSESPGIIEGLKAVRKNKEISVGRSLVVPKRGCSVCVTNVTDRPIKLSAGHLIGFYHPLCSTHDDTFPIQEDINVPQDPQLSGSCITAVSREKESEEVMEGDDRP